MNDKQYKDACKKADIKDSSCLRFDRIHYKGAYVTLMSDDNLAKTVTNFHRLIVGGQFAVARAVFVVLNQSESMPDVPLDVCVELTTSAVEEVDNV